jgi:hypothetical protein
MRYTWINALISKRMYLKKAFRYSNITAIRTTVYSKINTVATEETRK